MLLGERLQKKRLERLIGGVDWVINQAPVAGLDVKNLNKVRISLGDSYRRHLISPLD